MRTVGIGIISWLAPGDNDQDVHDPRRRDKASIRHGKVAICPGRWGFLMYDGITTVAGLRQSFRGSLILMWEIILYSIPKLTASHHPFGQYHTSESWRWSDKYLATFAMLYDHRYVDDFYLTQVSVPSENNLCLRGANLHPRHMWLPPAMNTTVTS